jgi:hypothetical protein
MLTEGGIEALARIDAGAWETRLLFSVASYCNNLEMRIFVFEQSIFTVANIKIIQ